jgi:hypothetical protein
MSFIWPWKLIYCLLRCLRIHAQEFYCSRVSERSNLKDIEERSVDGIVLIKTAANVFSAEELET